jgi:hypothetical protein
MQGHQVVRGVSASMPKASLRGVRATWQTGPQIGVTNSIKSIYI